MIKLRADGKEVEFEISKFPDGTSQVWQLKYEFSMLNYFHIDWIWENDETEILHVCQLIDLLKAQSPSCFIYLNIPYLPYARQDKGISNKTTFALTTFATILNSKNVNVVTSFDAHSNAPNYAIKKFQSVSPWDFHNRVYKDFQQDFSFYPDVGAAKRYGMQQEIMLFGEKVRNQVTGNIEGYKIVNADQFDLKGKKILITDDICDGGNTFIHATKALKEFGVGEIGLCVSHGIFSKEFRYMHDAGISKFYTTNSLKKNFSENKDFYNWETCLEGEYYFVYDILGERK